MAFDGLVLDAVLKELNETLVGGRIDRVTQPSPHDIVLQIRVERTNHRLLLSANRSYPRMHMTTRFQIPSPALPPLFCTMMRKHLEGGKIIALSQVGRERIAHIDVEIRDELGKKVTRRVVLEIMGKHSNLILLERPDGLILDAIVHLSQAVNRHREVLPGRPYVAPPAQNKFDPLKETRKGYLARREHTMNSFAKHLVATYEGISPFFAKEAAYNPAGDGGHTPTIDEEWLRFADTLQKTVHPSPTIVRGGRERADSFYLFPIQHLKGERVSYSFVNDCLDAYYAERAMSDIARSKATHLLRLAKQERARAVARIDTFEDVLSRSHEADFWRIAGELLTAYPHEVKKGTQEVTLPNFYQNEEPTHIPLDPARSPLDNANAYFKRYQRYKKGVEITREQLAQAREEVVYLDSVLHELAVCTVQEIPSIEMELREAGYLRMPAPSNTQKGKPQKGKTNKKQEKLQLAPAVYLSSDGTPIWVGRNNRENDVMTHRLARKTDIWLHVKNAPGSHVILHDAEPSEQALFEAAILAAHFSSLRDALRADVDWLPVKLLRKPNKARPGFVIFEGQSTLAVRYTKEQVEEILKRSAAFPGSA
ncbi:Rqc2 family fibronectin-binding protein [Ferroacidibacillus organovorans]|uniref:Rqc2 homolog RqcH n=1 Tax=Ferroacidibacillus organovorans TaxID=1765683 RepID=A0A101XQF4_9BACL|nr:NFACT RNA binding domain-containing protein [Ferroacidibacillus organovorans]KUO95587.1 hypothetical protein ATW55_06830 [Ferroacidibacillus organovorans]